MSSAVGAWHAWASAFNPPDQKCQVPPLWRVLAHACRWRGSSPGHVISHARSRRPSSQLAPTTSSLLVLTPVRPHLVTLSSLSPQELSRSKRRACLLWHVHYYAEMSTAARTTGRRGFTVGRSEDATHPDTIRAAISEFFATAIFVFAAEGSILSLGKLYHDMSTAGGLVAVALAHALALAVAVSVAVNISGGHVNPAITFGALLGGRITLVRALFYWVAQLLGAIVASLLLRLTTGGMRPPGFSLASGVSDWHAVLLEAVMTFGLMYAYYATVIDPKRGHVGTIGPLAVGFLLGANMLAGGPFDGAAMNPARVFGPALVGWRWRHHWVYWLGPFLGSGFAGLLYEYLVIPSTETAAHGHAHQPLAPEDY